MKTIEQRNAEIYQLRMELKRYKAALVAVYTLSGNDKTRYKPDSQKYEAIAREIEACINGMGLPLDYGCNEAELNAFTGRVFSNWKKIGKEYA